jgi:hypothetical protein
VHKNTGENKKKNKANSKMKKYQTSEEELGILPVQSTGDQRGTLLFNASEDTSANNIQQIHLF